MIEWTTELIAQIDSFSRAALSYLGELNVWCKLR
jgi:hypothetical protein